MLQLIIQPQLGHNQVMTERCEVLYDVRMILATAAKAMPYSRKPIAAKPSLRLNVPTRMRDESVERRAVGLTTVNGRST